MESSLKKNSHAIHCRHKDYTHLKIEIDFSEFWNGAPEKKGDARWGGAFRGRPLLADQIMPSIIALTHSAKPDAIKRILSSLRSFFRFLDAYEGWAEQQNVPSFTTKIELLEEITTHHLQMWKTTSLTGDWKQADFVNYAKVTAIIRNAARRFSLSQIIIPVYARKSAVDFNDVPDERVGKTLVKALAKEVNNIFKLWESSDALAKKGRNLCGVNRVPLMLNGGESGYTTLIVEGGVTEADLHASYRAAVTANHDMPLDRLQFLKMFGYGDGFKEWSTPIWWPRYGPNHPDSGKQVSFLDLQAGLYPTADQVAVLYLLFLARTGWNPSTTNMLDISEEDRWCKSYTEKYIWLFAFKNRSNAWQDTISSTNQRTGPFQIIMRLMARTEKLRKAIEDDPSLCSNIMIARRSPWIYQRTNQSNKAPVQVEIPSDQQSKILRNVIKAFNDAQADNKHISSKIKPTDLRDIFAAATLVNSNFSLFLTQLALGHKRAATTFAYLRRKAWRQESEKRKNEMFIELIDQIEIHRVVDLTLLRAKMDGVVVTEEMLERLEKYRGYRTYVGMGCSDPTNPPTFVDPANPRDGSTLCAQGHLCAGCPQGRVFNDSLPRLARRFAELEWLQGSLPLEVFQDSSLADQLTMIRTTIKQWKYKEVENHLAVWKARIASGEHVPIRFSGEH